MSLPPRAQCTQCEACVGWFTTRWDPIRRESVPHNTCVDASTPGSRTPQFLSTPTIATTLVAEAHVEGLTVVVSFPYHDPTTCDRRSSFICMVTPRREVQPLVTKVSRTSAVQPPIHMKARPAPKAVRPGWAPLDDAEAQQCTADKNFGSLKLMFKNLVISPHHVDAEGCYTFALRVFNSFPFFLSNSIAEHSECLAIDSGTHPIVRPPWLNLCNSPRKLED
ncbi:hypothetical protein B0H19DRAFT_1229107 [Mycena capillaripes]|nr:hypothetical protein B0H19DRAFT_1229107 [Mycena capillaripes]